MRDADDRQVMIAQIHDGRVAMDVARDEIARLNAELRAAREMTIDVDPDTLRFAAALVCASCQAYAAAAGLEYGKIATQKNATPTALPHEVERSAYRFWHRGMDGCRPVEWPCNASTIWVFLKQMETR